jgi:hypothetical protein
VLVNLGCVCAWIGCCAGLDFVLFQVEKSQKNRGSNLGTLAFSATLVTNNTNGISLTIEARRQESFLDKLHQSLGLIDKPVARRPVVLPQKLYKLLEGEVRHTKRLFKFVLMSHLEEVFLPDDLIGIPFWIPSTCGVFI